MPTELLALSANAGLLLALLLTQQVHHDVVRGIPWTFGNRDDQDLDPLGQRVVRTVRNHIESAAMFTPVAAAVVIGGLASSMTAYASIAFVALRLLYAIAYILGIPYLRSLLWTGAIVSLMVVGWPLVASQL